MESGGGVGPESVRSGRSVCLFDEWMILGPGAGRWVRSQVRKESCDATLCNQATPAARVDCCPSRVPLRRYYVVLVLVRPGIYLVRKEPRRLQDAPMRPVCVVGGKRELGERFCTTMKAKH